MIIGIKDNGKVIMAYSSFDGFSPINAEDMSLPENVGVWRVRKNAHTIMGCVFPTAESDAFRYEEDIFAGELSFEKLSYDVIPAMEKFSEDREYIGNDKGTRYEKFLIAQRDRLFRITSEHIVFEVDSFAALSDSGEDMAKSVLLATEGEPVVDRLRKAFEFAARARQCECYPITLIDTETGRLQTLAREQH